MLVSIHTHRDAEVTFKGHRCFDRMGELLVPSMELTFKWVLVRATDPAGGSAASWYVFNALL